MRKTKYPIYENNSILDGNFFFVSIKNYQSTSQAEEHLLTFSKHIIHHESLMPPC